MQSIKSVYFLLLLSLALLLINCNSDQLIGSKSSDAKKLAEQIKLHWQLLENNINNQSQFKAAFTIINQSKTAINNPNWNIYFSHSPRNIVKGKTTGPTTIKSVQGDLYQLSPSNDFNLPAGDSLLITFEGQGAVIKHSDGPSGVYIFASSDSSSANVINFQQLPFPGADQISRGETDRIPVPTAESDYYENQKLTMLASSQLLQIVPTPRHYQYQQGYMTVNKQSEIFYEKGLEFQAEYLADQIASIIGSRPLVKNGIGYKAGRILLRTGSVKVDGITKDAYHLLVNKDRGAEIIGNNATGILYGIQSFLSLIPVSAYSEKPTSVKVRRIRLKDAPRYHYRGLHLDLSRNFHQPASIKKVVDVMAFYKLNKLHLHLTDDEGWRIEIQGLPELTSIGSKRSSTYYDGQSLSPAYGSGADTLSSGSGYLSRATFIDLLQYARDRQIEVIPEINFPGHARAAIIAMEARYQKFAKANDMEEANRYRLINPSDQSSYTSVQNYTDNIVCVCQQSTYDFYEKVVDELIDMYKVADAPLTAIHTGGDEVPEGVWIKDPACQELIQENEALASKMNMQAYFLQKINDLLLERNLITAGWEEIALLKNEEGKYIPNPALTNKSISPYIWNNLWGSEDLAYRTANAGYEIVLCNVTNLYFDLAYNKDPQEPGLYWGGFVDTKKAFEFIPNNFYRSSLEDAYGNPLEESKVKQLTPLNTDAIKNISGIQGQLWTETIKNKESLEYYLLPKIIGLAQRAWEKETFWEMEPTDTTRQRMVNQEWIVMANTLGQKELLRLDHIFGGYHYRIPPPGVIYQGGVLKANTAFPGLTTVYTTDGTEPNEKSDTITSQININADQIKLKTLDSRGRGSRTVTVKKD